MPAFIPCFGSSLDSIGLSAFQYDFGSISGHASRIANAVDAFAQLDQTPLNVVAPLFLHIFPFIYRVPSARIRMMLELHASLRGAGAAIIENYMQSKNDPAYVGRGRLITSLGRIFAFVFSFIHKLTGWPRALIRINSQCAAGKERDEEPLGVRTHLHG